MHWIRGLPFVLLAGGAAAVLVAVVEGNARLLLVLFVPVVSGSSWVLGLGIALLFLGFVTLPLGLLPRAAARGEGSEKSPPPARAGTSEPEGASGGLVLVGPVPIFFGAWRTHAPIPPWVAALIGAALLGFLLLLVYAFLGAPI